jgi:hypothetical protein
MTKTPVSAGVSEKKGNPLPITDMLPPMILPDDSARTRKTDPLTSHAAADISQRGLRDAKRRVLQLVEVHAPVTGSELNDMYRLSADRRGWRRLAWDSPRKRASELASDGFLEVVGTRIAAGNNVPESAYGITDKGRKAIA